MRALLVLSFFAFSVPFCQKKLDVERQADPKVVPTVAAGRIQRIDSIQSAYVDSRPVDILLPEGYSFTKKYPVLYMHDGQMLFDSTKTWNGQEWLVDETLARLNRQRKLPQMIVVGIWNNGPYRRSEFFPEALIDSVGDPIRSELLRDVLSLRPRAEAYVRFIVEELKPFIDRTYGTFPEKEYTFIGGSSMGGVISLYAACRYPNVFGGVMGLSFHSPLVPVDKITTELETEVISRFPEFLMRNLPPKNSLRLYLDYGDQTIDAFYKPYQEKIDAVLRSKGWKSPYWETRFFPGTDHSEKAWSRRFEDALLFITAGMPARG
jgi:enterochelin esterase-like enzyme